MSSTTWTSRWRSRTPPAVGPSGCGKSTLLRIVDGLIRSDTGQGRIDGDVVQGRDVSHGHPSHGQPAHHHRASARSRPIGAGSDSRRTVPPPQALGLFIVDAQGRFDIPRLLAAVFFVTILAAELWGSLASSNIRLPPPGRGSELHGRGEYIRRVMAAVGSRCAPAEMDGARSGRMVGSSMTGGRSS